MEVEEIIKRWTYIVSHHKISRELEALILSTIQALSILQKEK